MQDRKISYTFFRLIYPSCFSVLFSFMNVTPATSLGRRSVSPSNLSVPAPSIVNEENCWWKCNKTTGPCESVCGAGGYCCRRGSKWEGLGCPTHLANTAHGHRHTCVKDIDGERPGGLLLLSK